MADNKRNLTVAAFGGGVDSTAMLIGLWQRQEPCDLILFADTGGEKPHTYEHIRIFSEWLIQHGMPPVIIVKSPNETLEESCLRLETLPSIAYGYKTCSQRFKGEPQNKYMRNWQPAKASWDRGEKITKLIGYDADEYWRAKLYEDEKYINRYPLIEWGWGRDEALAIIKSMGIKQPGKSACFFCPSSKKPEIITLKIQYPDLAKRAIAMEENSKLNHSVKGLGRSFAWGDLLHADEAQVKMFPETLIEQACGCYDG